jgi:hypothetical protein
MTVHDEPYLFEVQYVEKERFKYKSQKFRDKYFDVLYCRQGKKIWKRSYVLF